jgi:hypothetical protein
MMQLEDRPQIIVRPGYAYDAADGEVVLLTHRAESDRYAATNGWKYSRNGSFRGDSQPSAHDLVRCRGRVS